MARDFFLKIDPLRACCHCGAKARRVSLLCEFCHEQLEARMLSPHTSFCRLGGHLKSYALWNWTHEPLLGSFIRALKIERDPLGLWQYWAQRFWSLRCQLGGEGLFRSILIPPPRPKWQRDHAFYFAQELASLLQIPLLRILENTGPSLPQKRRSWQQRQAKTFLATKKLKASQLPLLWVDDVVTTGATARAALKALKLKPSNVELWCLVRKLRSPQAL